MPELPEVETFRRYLDATVMKRTIESVSVEKPRILDGTNPQGLGRMLSGRTITGSRRRGKYLFAEMDSGAAIMLHFGMTGSLAAYDDESSAPEYPGVTLTFTDGRRLAVISKRLLGKVSVVDDIDDAITELNLGPDALDVEKTTFIELLKDSRKMIKAVFLDQSLIAGLGNEYGDEVLFQAHIHPRTKASDIGEETAGQLFDVMVRVLKTAVDKSAEWERYPETWLLPNRDEGAPCPGSCGGTLEKINVGGRNGIFCPACQKG